MKESQLAESVNQFLSVALPREAVHFHPANEGKRSLAAAAALLRQGMLPGLPDICIVCGGKAYWIELKSARGSLSEAQKICHRRLRLAGCDVVVAHSIAEVALALDSFGIPLSARVAAE